MLLRLLTKSTCLLPRDSVFHFLTLRVLPATVKRRFVTNVTKTVKNNSNRVAVIDTNGSYSYNQIYAQAQLIAGQLDAKPGLILCILLVPCRDRNYDF